MRVIIAGIIAILAMVALILHPGDPAFVGVLTLTVGYIIGTGDASGIIPKKKPPTDDEPK